MSDNNLLKATQEASWPRRDLDMDIPDLSLSPEPFWSILTRNAYIGTILGQGPHCLLTSDFVLTSSQGRVGNGSNALKRQGHMLKPGV